MAESLAARWLREHRGLRVIVANWRNPRDGREELDLVSDVRGALVFVEVKARAAAALVPGYYAIDQRKKRALRRAIKAYLARLMPKPPTFRFDVVEVELSPVIGGAPIVRHFENVPLFSKYFRG